MQARVNNDLLPDSKVRGEFASLSHYDRKELENKGFIERVPGERGVYRLVRED